MKQGPWLNGWNDLVANIKVSMNCVKLLDVQGNGQNNLVIAEQSGRLICYKNTHIDWETRVPGTPVAITYFYSEQQISNQPQPYIAVGCGNSIFVYRVFKAFYQFKLPLISMNQQEEQIWKQYQQDHKLTQLVTALNSGIQLCYKSQELLCYLDKEKQEEIANSYCENLQLEDIVTCLDILKKQGDDEYTPSQLVIGTELKYVYILNSDVTQAVKSHQLLSTPIQICTFSDDQVAGRIAVLARDNCVYFIGQEIENYKLDLASKPITMIKQQKQIYISTMDKVVSCYKQKQKLFQIQFQFNILCLESLEFGKGKTIKGILIALDNQTIQFYQEKQLISTIQLDINVSVMKFGQFGREDGFLVIINTQGGIDTKVLQRQFQSTVQQQIEQSQQIQIPKKTKLFVEQAKRERDQGTEILKQYQHDLLKMRLKTAETYLNILSNEQLAPQLSQTSQVRFNAIVEGLGPLFKIICQIENLGNSVISLFVAYSYNQAVYELVNPIQQLHSLIPKNQNKFELFIRSITDNGMSDIIKIHLFQESPIISVSIQMPLSELD